MLGFVSATVYGVLPMCKQTGAQGIGFALEDGTVLRLKLNEADALLLAANMAEYQRAAGRDTTVQAEMSVLTPQMAGLPQDGQNVTPVTNSSKAVCDDA